MPRETELDVNRNKCMYCGACVGICPTLALELHETIVVHYPDKCDGCQICGRICPVGAITITLKEAQAAR